MIFSYQRLDKKNEIIGDYAKFSLYVALNE